MLKLQEFTRLKWAGIASLMQGNSCLTRLGFFVCSSLQRKKERKKKGCLFLCWVSEIPKQLPGGVRYPGKESCAQEHQDSLLRDCVGKSQQVSLLLWLPATFPSMSQLCLGSWICLRTLPMTRQPAWESERWSSCQKTPLTGNCSGGDTNAVFLLWPRPAPWPKKHLYLPISLCDLIWASGCRALIVKFGVLGRHQFLIAFMQCTFPSMLQNYHFISSSITSQLQQLC